MKNRNIVFAAILFLTVLFILIPVLLVVVWSFVSRWSWPELLPQGVSLRGMEELFGEHSGVFGILFSSILLSLTAAVIATVIGLMSARAFVFYEFRGKAFLRFGAMLPMIIPANVFAMGIHVVFIRWGLSDTVHGVLVCHVIYCLPYTISILTEMTESVGKKYEEQSLVLGYSPVNTFFHITLPLLLPAVLSSSAMAYIISFSQYFLTVLIGGGKVKTFSMIMVPYITGGDRTVSSAYVMLFLLSSLFLFVLFEFIMKRLVHRLRGKTYEIET